ncbi:Multidrug resistance protein abc superfamily, partial [Globisporangium splendens]
MWVRTIGHAKEEWAKREAAIAVEETAFEAGPADDASMLRLKSVSASSVNCTSSLQCDSLDSLPLVVLLDGHWFLRGIQNASGAFFYMILVLIFLMPPHARALANGFGCMSREHRDYVISWYISRSLCGIQDHPADRVFRAGVPADGHRFFKYESLLSGEFYSGDLKYNTYMSINAACLRKKSNYVADTPKSTLTWRKLWLQLSVRNTATKQVEEKVMRTTPPDLLALARLRLGKSFTEEQYMVRVDEIIEEVGLMHRRDALIGGMFVWERKLLSIATEMLSNPSVLLVEEPASGLDSLSAEIVMSKLQQIARSGRTVIVTVHQPTSEVFALADSLYLLSEGTAVFCGKASEANGYFASLGYECPSYSSQIGYYLRLLIIQSRETDHVGAARLAMLKEEWAKREAAIAVEETAFEAGPADDGVDAEAEISLGFFSQLYVLITRNVIRLIRYRWWFFWMVIWFLVIAVIFGLIYLNLDMTQRGIQNTSGAFFYMILVLIFLMVYRTLAHLPKDLVLMSREQKGGWYYVILWFIARSLCAVPREIILPIVFFVPVYLLMDIDFGFKVYFYMQVMVILVSSAAIGLGYLIISLIRRVWLAWLIYAIVIMVFVIFCGYFVSDDDVPNGLSWISYFSPIKYGYQGLMNLYWGRVTTIDCDLSTENCIARTGSEVLTYYSLRRRSTLTDGFILFGINIAFRLISLFALLWIPGQFHLEVVPSQFNLSGMYCCKSSTRSLPVEDNNVHANGTAAKLSGAANASTCGDGSAEFENNDHFIEVQTPRDQDVNGVHIPTYTLQWRKMWLRRTVRGANAMYSEEKVVLSNMSGSARPGELLLITGTSAAESKMLLECIGGRNASVQGSIGMNGMLWTRKMKRYISYVIEEDLFYETITVREHLIFQARLRLGKSFTEEQYMLRVDEIIEEVGLMHRRDALIGGMFVWERKLLSIATEMLSNPSVLLVEEPASGLDSLSAEIVMSKLQQIARSGRTVIVTVHQPTSEVFALADSLYLLSEGTAVFCGKASEANGYFASLGYECPSYSSQIGYYLRLLIIQSRETDHVGAARLAMLKEEWAKREAAIAVEETAFEAGPADDGVDAEAEISLGFFGQLYVLITRNVIRLVRYRWWFFWMVIWFLVIAVIFGLIYLNLDMTQRGIQNTSGAFFYMILVLIFLMAYRTLAHLPKDLAVMSREHRGGWYYVILWFIARSLCAVPREIILPIVFFVPVYLLMDIDFGFKVYFYMQVMLILVSSAAIGLGYLIISLIRRVWLAWLIYAIVITLFLIFGGFVINVKDIPDYVVWIHYMSPIKYAYEGLMKIYWVRVASIPMRHRSALADGFIVFGINVLCRFISVIAVWFRLHNKKN